jgi:hypothetical protein
MSRLANILAAALLALAVGVVALWVRSYFVQDLVHCLHGTRLLSIYSGAGTIALTTVSPPMMRPSPLRIIREPLDERPEPHGNYARSLVSFDAGTKPWGAFVIEFPHWPVAAAAAAWPIARFVRARRRRRTQPGGFPVATP